MPKKVILYFNSVLPHFTQLLSGLEYLREKKLIDLEYRLKKFEFPPYIFKVEVDGRQLFFDMADNSEIHTGIYERADHYIKRMLLKTDFKSRDKLVPFGLNYQVYYKNNYLKTLFLKDHKLLKYSLRFSGTASKLLNIKDCIRNNELSRMQSLPFPGKKIVFRSRLWDPGRTITDWKKEERDILNKDRIELHRYLKKAFAEDFRGGIQRDAFSRNLGKEILLSKSEYHKRNYLKILKNSSIGIVNRGLENSISWKFGEYISHSLAVVTTPIDEYQLLGPLKEEEHYLTFRSSEECFEKTDLLYNNDQLRMEMQRANRAYYEQWLHPGEKLLRIFECIN